MKDCQAALQLSPFLRQAAACQDGLVASDQGVPPFVKGPPWAEAKTTAQFGPHLKIQEPAGITGSRAFSQRNCKRKPASISS